MSHLTTYELVAIFDPNLESEQVESDLRKIRDLIAGHKGMFRRWERWGKRRLADEIRPRQYGQYVLAVYDLETSETHELDRLLHLTPSLLRHLVTVVDPARVPEVDEESVRTLGIVKEVPAEPEAGAVAAEPAVEVEDLAVDVAEAVDDTTDEQNA
ncbi:MAG: 30S ribosomal protein S6 [bacterium]|nr:30S ribosomal protein S6 [bacterium]